MVSILSHDNHVTIIIEPTESSSPVIGNPSLPLGEVKLKKTTPNVAPPPKEEPTFENELLAKLKRRQASLDQPAAQPTSREGTTEEPIAEITDTPHHVDTPPMDTPTHNVQKQSPSVSYKTYYII